MLILIHTLSPLTLKFWKTIIIKCIQVLFISSHKHKGFKIKEDFLLCLMHSAKGGVSPHITPPGKGQMSLFTLKDCQQLGKQILYSQ